MAFDPLHQILARVQQSKRWQRRGAVQAIIQQWATLVGPMVAQHTQPLRIERRVLQVGASSAVWAQNLRFERQRILQKLHTLGLADVHDIQFSTAWWPKQQAIAHRFETSAQVEAWANHPSRLQGERTTNLQQRETPDASPEAVSTKPMEPTEPDNLALNAVNAFVEWSVQRQQDTLDAPHCPQCGCRTPQAELQRWHCCAFCFSQSRP